MTWLGFMLRNLLRRPGRSLFTLIGVALAVASFLILAGLSRGMNTMAHASLAERSAHLVVMQRGMVEFFSSRLPEAFETALRAVPGVAGVAPELGAVLPVGEEHHALVGGWRPDSPFWLEIPLLRGKLPVPGEGAVVLGESLAEALQADVGSTVKIGFTPLRVAGISGFTSMLNRSTALMPLADLQALLARPGEVTLFQIRLARPDDRAEVDAVRKAIMALRPGITVAAGDELLRENRALRIIDDASRTIALIALAMAALSVFTTLAMAVEERVREIGILAALGWTRRHILALILGEGLLLAVAGGMAGALLGAFGLSALSYAVLPGGLEASSSLILGATGIAVAAAIGVIGAFYPAYRAARLRPAAALRHD